MTQRHSMTRLGTVRAAGRAGREHAEPRAPGWPAVIVRVAGSGLLIATAAIHLDLYLTGYRTIPVIGWLFLLQVIAASGVGLAVLALPGRLILADRLAAAAGAGFALAALGGYLLSVAIGLFGFTEVRTTAGIVAGLIEVAAFAVLAALALIPARADAAVRFPVNGAIPVQGALAVNGADPGTGHHGQPGAAGPGRHDHPNRWHPPAHLQRAPAVHLHRRQRPRPGPRQQPQPERRPLARGARLPAIGNAGRTHPTAHQPGPSRLAKENPDDITEQHAARRPDRLDADDRGPYGEPRLS